MLTIPAITTMLAATSLYAASWVYGHGLLFTPQAIKSARTDD